MNSKLARLVGVLMTVVFVAAACGGDATTETATDTSAVGPGSDQASADTPSPDDGTMLDQGMLDQEMADPDQGPDDGIEVPDGDTSGDAPASTTTPAATDPEPADAETSTLADVVIDVSFDGDNVTVADDSVAIERGSTVALRVVSSVGDHVHVHGYDLVVDVGPTLPGELVFTADIPGVFEVEFEESGRFLAELVVS